MRQPASSHAPRSIEKACGPLNQRNASRTASDDRDHAAASAADPAAVPRAARVRGHRLAQLGRAVRASGVGVALDLLRVKGVRTRRRLRFGCPRAMQSTGRDARTTRSATMAHVRPARVPPPSACSPSSSAAARGRFRRRPHRSPPRRRRRFPTPTPRPPRRTGSRAPSSRSRCRPRRRARSREPILRGGAGATPAVRARRRSRACLLLQAAVDPSVSFVSGRVRLEVRGRASCGFAVLASETGSSSSRSRSSGGAAVARAERRVSDRHRARPRRGDAHRDRLPGWRNCRYAARPAGAARVTGSDSGARLPAGGRPLGARRRAARRRSLSVKLQRSQTK
jgi:hypothetical protein